MERDNKDDNIKKYEKIWNNNPEDHTTWNSSLLYWNT